MSKVLRACDFCGRTFNSKDVYMYCSPECRQMDEDTDSFLTDLAEDEIEYDKHHTDGDRAALALEADYQGWRKSE